MSRQRALLSCFLIWHLMAVIAAVIPAAGSSQSAPSPKPRDLNFVSSRLAGPLDVTARWAASMVNVLHRALHPIRLVTAPYLQVLGFDERWVMFSTPTTSDHYVRIRYFIETADRGTRTATELVLPASPEEHIRALASFRGSYQDRALNTALETFHADGQNPSSIARESPYQPIANYFVHRYARSRLTTGERVTRVEVWHGVAPNAAPGVDGLTPQARLNLLQDYRIGLVDSLGPVAAAAPGATEREADIGWSLEFVQTR